MIVISGTATVKPEAVARAEAAARTMMAKSRAEPGCLTYELSRTLDDPNTFRMFEEWETQAALDHHFTTPHMAEFSKTLGEVLAAPPQFSRYEIASTGPLRRAAAPAPDPHLGDVATHLLFENPLVRVWQMKLAPGQASPRHRHDLPYLMCVVSGTSIDADWDGQAPVTIPVSPGDVLFVPPGQTETAVNRSDVAFLEILIELKQPFDISRLSLQTHLGARR